MNTPNKNSAVKWLPQNYPARYSIYGLLLGFCFPVIATAVDIVFVRQLSLNLANILHSQTTQPLHWIIDTAPLILGLFAYLIGQRQKHLVDAQNKYQFLAYHTTDFIWAMDSDLNLTYCSPSIAQLTGYSPEEYAEIPPLERYPAEALKTIDKVVREELEVETSEAKPRDRRRILTLPLKKKQGGTVWVEAAANILHSKNGQEISIVGVSRDITERIEAQRQREEREELFENIFENTVIGLYQSTPDGKILMANPALVSMLGFSSLEELREQDLEDLALQNSYKRTDFIERIERDGKIIGMESVTYRSDGTQLISRENARAVRDANGTTLYYHGTIEDITERVQAVEELQENEERFRTLFENATIGLYRTSPDGRILMANPALIRMLGYSSLKELEQRRLDDSESFADGFKRSDFLERIEHDGKIIGMESAWLKKDGSLLSVRENASTVKDADGNTVYFDGAVEDISLHKEAEATNERLEAQLIQAQKMEAIGQLAGGVAHDFNNLLSVILGYSELMQLDETLNEEQQDQLQQIYDAGQRAQTLTQQLLTFSRKQIARPRPTNLNTEIENGLKMYIRLLGEDIEVTFQPGPDLPSIMADTQQLDQILANMLINARDAINACTEQNRQRLISMSTSLIEVGDSLARDYDITPGFYTCLSISDTGTGMDHKTQARIFDPCFTTKGEGKGTGLGLSTVYGAVAQNNGAIRVYSEPGQGTTFRILWPAMKSTMDSGTQQMENRHLQQGRENLLLVEDEKSVREVTYKLLTGLGYHVTAIEDGEHALELLINGDLQPDLLITDLVLPGINGRQLAEHSLKIIPDLPILYTSGYTQDIISQQGMLSDDIELVEKPFRATDFTDKIRALLDRE